ncbi:reverse transcriptase [Plakobranchus ocellatus]|uniref:Reverse transcriptase n=1 Tax=Plakobranchus ocellatus TaxID=259542 RepID=A0AAV4CZU3_9GAST|nr:reverse transcriptase [Plakobranchus ocellatus]
MIWEAIQRAKSEKLNLDVVWLDLANAYGSVPHEMIQLVLRMYHVPEDIQVMLDDYFSGFRMMFSTNDYTTNWINPEVGIAMECTLSSILFVMAMEVILKAAEGSAGPANLGGGCSMPPLKTFMEDTAIICSKEDETRRMLTRLDVLMSWRRMEFKPKKSRSLSIRKGKFVETITFTVAEQQIPTVSQEPVKSLGRWYDSSMKDTRRGAETLELASESLLAINKCGLQGKFKIWCLQFMLIPKLLWPLLVYDICSTTVEAIEAKINKYTRKWLGIPPSLSDVAMYCRKAKLKLPLKSILEEYKCGKVRLLTMLEESDDPVVKTVQPCLKTGRKWKVTEAVDEAKECLKMKESITINTHRKGLLDNCDDWVVSADLPEWERHPDVIRKTALRPDIVIHSASTQQIIMVELTVPYESRMEEAHALKEGKYLDLTKELKKDGYEAKVMTVEIGARGFVGSSVYGLLSKLSICGNKRTKATKTTSRNS